jgi:hypothetical protein
MLEAVRDSYAPCYHKRLGLRASYHSLTLWRLWSPNSWLPGRPTTNERRGGHGGPPLHSSGLLICGFEVEGQLRCDADRFAGLSRRFPRPLFCSLYRCVREERLAGGGGAGGEPGLAGGGGGGGGGPGCELPGSSGGGGAGGGLPGGGGGGGGGNSPHILPLSKLTPSSLIVNVPGLPGVMKSLRRSADSV